MHDGKRDPLNLSGLPQPEPPPGDPWPAIAAELQRQRRRRISGWSAAAAVALSLGLAWQVLQQAPVPQADPTFAAGRAAEPAVAADIQPVEASSPGADTQPVDEIEHDADTLAALVGLSQQLESRLRVLRADAGAMPADTLIYQVELEDLVAQVDDALSRRPDSRVLWSQRVNLLLDLNQLYHQELRREQGPIASL